MAKTSTQPARSYSDILPILRDRTAPTAAFRAASDAIAALICADAVAALCPGAIGNATEDSASAPDIDAAPNSNPAPNCGSDAPETPNARANAAAPDANAALGQNIILVPVLRAGLALLPAFMAALPAAPVGFIGIRRDERAATPSIYYESLPSAFPYAPPSAAMLLDPMLATAGSACLAADILAAKGMPRDRIFFAGVLAAQEGLERLQAAIPPANITLAAVDPDLDARKFIVPGIGDYGDRYFGAQ